MTQERIRFAGDPIVGESGSGAEPQIPLDKTIRPTKVEMLNKKGEDDEDEEDDKPKSFQKNARGRTPVVEEDDDDDEDELDEETPGYERERIGARIGQTMEDAQSVVEVERELEADDVVPMVFPIPVHLQDKGLMHHWQPGVHLVPVSIAGNSNKERHFWLKANKVRHAGKRIPNPSV
jgi:hypothetical protein